MTQPIGERPGDWQVACLLCGHSRLRARRLCERCYYQARRANRLHEFPRTNGTGGRPVDVSQMHCCPSCVAALRVEVSSAMRANAFVPACPHRGAA